VNLTVSVIIPAYNCETTIERALQSAIQQTRPPKEIIVIDDESTDQSALRARSKAKDSAIPILVYCNESNVGPGVSRNRGWAAATGDLVAFLDADDVWHPQKLEVQVPIMESRPTLNMTCHDRTVGPEPVWSSVDSKSVTWQELDLRDFLIRNRCATPSVILRRDVRERFSDSLRYAEDYSLWLTIAAQYGEVLFAESELVHCTNPAYGGPGLSGKLLAMHKSELKAFRMLARRGVLPLRWLPAIYGWSTLKFGVRVVDHLLLKDRLQKAAEA
jgi:glycosyltransferase involved in cell wall biosynthesis